MHPPVTPTIPARHLQAGEAWLVLCALLQVGMGGLVVHLVSGRQADLPWMVAIRFLIGLGLMIACDIASQFCLSHGLASVPVAKGTTILLLIPVLSLLAGAVLFGEQLSLRQWSSCLLVLAAAVLAIVARAPSRAATGETLFPTPPSGDPWRTLATRSPAHPPVPTVDKEAVP